HSMTFLIETVTVVSVSIEMCSVLIADISSYSGLYWAWYFGSSSGFLMCLILSIRIIRSLPRTSERLPDGER
ncbi:MAG: hypothetical protein LUB58_03705, partial [Oscillospiraceae bacterium]|nr:hypothetical protein [Oscillospiraceae bacterium]